MQPCYKTKDSAARLIRVSCLHCHGSASLPTATGREWCMALRSRVVKISS
uniref:Uncharacterized protein n=1 Tax=Arundo donax TaxID=35708 RepID=A0A0A9G0K4_ARUDO